MWATVVGVFGRVLGLVVPWIVMVAASGVLRSGAERTEGFEKGKRGFGGCAEEEEAEVKRGR